MSILKTTTREIHNLNSFVHQNNLKIPIPKKCTSYALNVFHHKEMHRNEINDRRNLVKKLLMGTIHQLVRKTHQKYYYIPGSIFGKMSSHTTSLQVSQKIPNVLQLSQNCEVENHKMSLNQTMKNKILAMSILNY